MIQLQLFIKNISLTQIDSVQKLTCQNSKSCNQNTLFVSDMKCRDTMSISVIILNNYFFQLMIYYLILINI